MRVECTNCGTYVDAESKGKFYSSNEWEDASYEFSLLCCPSCSGPILISREGYYFGDGEVEWSSPKALYPILTKKIGSVVPDEIQFSYEEAERCLKVKAYTALTIMCRRTLEAVCAHFGEKSGNLASKLNKLNQNGMIDKTMADWAKMLRLEGNAAAHDVSERVSPEDAQDVLDFTHGLIEYLFTYKQKFAEFEARKAKREAAKIKPAESVS